MNDKVLHTLEYDKIIAELSELAGTSMGKKKCSELKPYGKIETIRQLQAETSDALARIYKKGSLSFSGISDIQPSLKRLEVGGCLGIVELLRISSMLTAALRAKSYESGEDARDTLTSKFEAIEPLSALNNEINRCIISEEEIADDASNGLKSVRRNIKLTNDKVRDALSKILSSSSSMLQDTIITMRNGRYCLPVKQEYKNSFDGMEHDQSATGSTVFMEPMAVVKLNNELSELAVREKEEIEKVLETLSSLAAENIGSLSCDLVTLSELDFIFARGLLAKQMKATEPVFNKNRFINIKKGRHPLIEAHKAVPIDIYLGVNPQPEGDGYKPFTMLVITGPNTGGKTVTLKTIGLLTLMGQSGLHIPAMDGSSLGIFKEVYADIGDEQSIEQSLSTFSSHMTNTVKILSQADKDSLVLFDELGAGTDPVEGAALAMAILTHLHEKDIHTIATTHYSELKMFALSTSGVTNGSCEFNVETLSPTYKLLIGVPGKSNAFAISKKLGLGDDIIEIAGGFIETKDESFEDVISGLNNEKALVAKEREEAEAALKAAKDNEQKVLEKSRKVDNTKEKLIREANEEARRILQEAKDYADETIRKINKLSQSGNQTKEMEKERQNLREKLGNTDEKIIAVRKSSAKTATEVFKTGDIVRVISMDIEGKVLSEPDAKGEVEVSMGILHSKISSDDLELIKSVKEVKEEEHKQKVGNSIRMAKAMRISPELNIIGMHTAEAESVVEGYIDDAYLAHLPKITIIHGRGTGALRDLVADVCKRTKYVSSFRAGWFGEGDMGVTIVEFKY